MASCWPPQSSRNRASGHGAAASEHCAQRCDAASTERRVAQRCHGASAEHRVALDGHAAPAAAAAAATEHSATTDGTATEHAPASASVKGSASGDNAPLETVFQEPDSSYNTGLPVTLRYLGLVVKKHADNYKPEGIPDVYFQGEQFKLKDIRDEYMHQRPPCDQMILYACIKALLVVYDVDKSEHTATMTDCVPKKHKRMTHIYNMFHIDATASVEQFADSRPCQQLSQDHVLMSLTAGLYADLYPNQTTASPMSPQQVQRAECYLHRLGACLHPEESNGPLHVDT